MKVASKHPNETQRQKSLEALNILDSLPESDFDEITQLASEICGTPIALISLVDKDRQWFKSKVGLNASETPRDLAFCAHAILQNEVFIVENSSQDNRFFDNPLATGAPHVQFYAGAPLLSPDGQPIGTLCVIDTKSRHLLPKQSSSLKLLSNQVTRLLELRVQIQNLQETQVSLNTHKIAIEAISEGVIVNDVSGGLLEINSSALRILGTTKKETLGSRQDWSKLNPTHEDGTPLMTGDFPGAIALRTGKSARKDTVGITNSLGSKMWLQVSAEPIFKNGTTELFGVAISLSDITSHIENKIRIKRSQSELRFILDSIPHMIGYWSHDFINLNSNKAYLHYFGKNPEEIRGKHLQNLLGKELFEKTTPYLQEVLKGKTVKLERQLPDRAGTMTHTLSTFVPHIIDGKVCSFLAIIMDITELKNLEIDRQKLELQLAETARLSALGEMAAGIAHEVNNPLAIIRGKTGILKNRLSENKLDKEKGVKDLGIIESTVDRIAKIIKGLKTYSRNAENDPFQMTRVQSIIDDTLELCAEKLKAESIKVILKYDSDVKIPCRPSQISQVLMNLLANAADAIAEQKDKWIDIKVTEDQNYITIFITDCGSGISSEIAKKMMQPFFTTKDVGKGTGLGLSISMGIAETHGGKLNYLPAEKNTTFCLKLPKTHSQDLKKAS